MRTTRAVRPRAGEQPTAPSQRRPTSATTARTNPARQPNALPLQKLTIGPVSSGDALTLYKLAQGLGLVEAGLYKAERIGGQIMQILTIGPVSSGDAWLIMRKCAALELTDRGLYLAEYVTE